MTATAEQQDPSEYSEDDISYEDFVNYGQVARDVHGDQVQNFFEFKLLNRLVNAQQLERAYIDRVMAAFVDRSYRRRGQADLWRREDAARLLAKEPCLVLLGAPGSGLTTAAIALLAEFSRAGRRLERILLDEEIGQPVSGADLPAERGVVYLLRLPDQLDRTGLNFGAALQAHADRLATLDAHLVVTATDVVWASIDGAGTDLPVLEVAAPDPAGLLKQQCRAAGMTALGLISDQRIASLLQRMSTADAGRLAEIVVTTVGDRPQAALDELVDEVVGAYGDWDAELGEWFSQHQELRIRLFKVAAAMLEGHPAADILSTVNSLGKELGDLTAGQVDGLAQAGLRDLTDRIKAEISHGRVYFRRANYAAAVLTFLHADRSTQFRTNLWRWAAELALRPSPRRSDLIAARVVEMMLTIALRHHDPRPLTQLRRWVDREHLRGHVVAALTAAAVSDEVGTAIRAQLYTWARDSRHDHLLAVVADICGGELADLYPRISLTRLRHLATRQSPTVNARVTAAVGGLWKRPRLRRQVLASVLDWLRDDRRQAVAWQIVAALPDPHPLVIAALHAPIWSSLVEAFATGLGQPSRAEAAVFGDSVLETALSDPGTVSGFLVDTVRCGSGGTRRFVQLVRLLHQWQPTGQDDLEPVRSELRNRLIETLHLADPLTTGG